MLTVNKLMPAGRGLAPVLLKRASNVRLDWDTRQKSRFEATDSVGRNLGVFLPRGSVVRGGDVLVAEDGSLVRVDAAPQPVMVVRACLHHGSPFDLTRAAYHLGNRHVQIELQPDHLKIEPDHVLGEMLDRMHLIVTREEASFEPEAGAYAGGHGHGHGHEHAGGHAQAHPHAHVHEPAVAPAGRAVPIPVKAAAQAHVHGHVHEHVHGPGCGHDHGHDHGHGHAPAHDHDHDPTHRHG